MERMDHVQLQEEIKDWLFKVRDKERIRPFMEELTAVWEEYPDLRFMQFVEFLYSQAERDPFSYEEEDTLALLECLTLKTHEESD